MGALWSLRPTGASWPSNPHAIAYLDRDAIKVSVFMNVFNVHSNRSPVDGEVRQAWYHPGKFFNAALDKASLENERNALWLKTATGADVTCVQIAGLSRDGSFATSNPGTGSREASASASFASDRVWTSICPSSASVEAALGDKVHGGSSILAVL